MRNLRMPMLQNIVLVISELLSDLGYSMFSTLASSQQTKNKSEVACLMLLGSCLLEMLCVMKPLLIVDNNIWWPAN